MNNKNLEEKNAFNLTNCKLHRYERIIMENMQDYAAGNAFSMFGCVWRFFNAILKREIEENAIMLNAINGCYCI